MVTFRYSSREKARELDLSGFARNEPDNGVYIEVEGEEENLKKFLAWCRKGPAWARVEKIIIDESELKNFNQFTIEY